MRFRIRISPSGLGNPDQTQSFDLGEMEAGSRDDVTDFLETIGDCGTPFVPSHFDYIIEEVSEESLLEAIS